MNDVKPRKPWALSIQERLTLGGGILLALALATFMVKETGLDGKLGFTASFFFLSIFIQVLIGFLRRGKKAIGDVFASGIIYSGAIAVILPVASILVLTVQRGFAGLNLKFFTQSMESTSFLDPLGNGGVLHALLGTFYLIFFASLISVPMGIITALYLTELRGKASGIIQFVVQAMSGVPSVVAGLFIYAAIIVVTPIKQSSFVGALALTILMVPTVTRTAQEILLLIPNDLREAGLAMGATQWKTVSTIVVPAARNGLITAVILGIARITGETAPLIFTLGVADKLNLNPFKDWNSALPIYVWKGLLLGTPESIQRAWSAILVLLIIILIMFITARTLGSRSFKK